MENTASLQDKDGKSREHCPIFHCRRRIEEGGNCPEKGVIRKSLLLRNTLTNLLARRENGEKRDRKLQQDDEELQSCWWGEETARKTEMEDYMLSIELDKDRGSNHVRHAVMGFRSGKTEINFPEESLTGCSRPNGGISMLLGRTGVPCVKGEEHLWTRI
ncbi:hypothetical protein J6590_008137 [Homalodisca vitripennis]|nr:hypothetical protein J6590_008137 [Homalodisca vitripennis]